MNHKDLFRHIGVLCGGPGAEREVSLRSGSNVFKQLKRYGYHTTKIIIPENRQKIKETFDILKSSKIDAAYNTLHGEFGEDGHIQALLTSLNIPYTGENVLNSALCYHKIRTKETLTANHITTPFYIRLSDLKKNGKSEYADELKKQKIDLPCMLKNVRGGSSVGVILCDNQEILNDSVKEIFQKGEEEHWYFEEHIQGQEITVGIFRHEKKLFILPFLGLKSRNAFYDYEAKYQSGMTKMEIPLKLDKNLTTRIENTVRKIYKIFSFKSCIRIDFMIKEKIPYCLEINTQPGMTETSDIPAMIEHSEISMKEFLEINLNEAACF